MGPGHCPTIITQPPSNRRLGGRQWRCQLTRGNHEVVLPALGADLSTSFKIEVAKQRTTPVSAISAAIWIDAASRLRLCRWPRRAPAAPDAKGKAGDEHDKCDHAGDAGDSRVVGEHTPQVEEVVPVVDDITASAQRH